MKKIFDCCSHLYTTTHDLVFFFSPAFIKMYNYLFNEITKKLKNQIFLFRFKLNLTNEKKKPVNIYIYIRLCLHFFL